MDNQKAVKMLVVIILPKLTSLFIHLVVC